MFIPLEDFLKDDALHLEILVTNDAGNINELIDDANLDSCLGVVAVQVDQRTRQKALETDRAVKYRNGYLIPIYKPNIIRLHIFFAGVNSWFVTEDIFTHDVIITDMSVVSYIPRIA